MTRAKRIVIEPHHFRMKNGVSTIVAAKAAVRARVRAAVTSFNSLFYPRACCAAETSVMRKTCGTGIVPSFEEGRPRRSTIIALPKTRRGRGGQAGEPDGFSLSNPTRQKDHTGAMVTS